MLPAVSVYPVKQWKDAALHLDEAPLHAATRTVVMPVVGRGCRDPRKVSCLNDDCVNVYRFIMLIVLWRVEGGREGKTGRGGDCKALVVISCDIKV